MEENRRVLFIDDEVNVLNSIRRQLRGKYELITAESGHNGLEIMAKEKTFAVVISDFKMPEMNGLEFLTRAKQLSPDSVRIMLTGQADFDAIISVINEGNIFRFLSKPCPPDLLVNNLEDGLRQYQLVTAEKELLSKTLSGSLQVMADMLVLARPEAFNRSIRIKNIIGKMLQYLSPDNSWQIEIAAMLSQIGCITVPDEILKKVFKNETLSTEEKIIYQLHAKTSSELIDKIPRLEKVAEIIAYQEKYYNGTGMPAGETRGEDLPLGSRMIRLVSDYDRLASTGVNMKEALDILTENTALYDQSLVPVLKKALSDEKSPKKYITKKVAINELNDKMYLAKPVVTASGIILGSARQKINETLIITLMNHAKNKEIGRDVVVLQLSD